MSHSGFRSISMRQYLHSWGKIWYYFKFWAMCTSLIFCRTHIPKRYMLSSRASYIRSNRVFISLRWLNNESKLNQETVTAVYYIFNLMSCHKVYLLCMFLYNAVSIYSIQLHWWYRGFVELALDCVQCETFSVSDIESRCIHNVNISSQP
jgi:hypothetical protein